MESIWSKEIKIEEKKENLERTKYDIIVIGAGMAGILSAYKLVKQGYDVLVVEADKIASGQTKNTTAKITAQHGLIYHRLIKEIGEIKAKQYYESNQKALKDFEEIIKEEHLECDFKKTTAYLYTRLDKASLEEEAVAYETLGISGELSKDIDVPFDYALMLSMHNQGMFNPLKFINGLIKYLHILENTRVLSVNGNELVTNNGTFSANKIIFATHFPFINAPGFFFMKMHQERSYALALENVAPVNGIYYGIDKGSFSFRDYDHYVIVGGSNHKSGKNKWGEKYKNLETKALQIFPDAKIMTKWSAQDCMSLDGIPYIGTYSGSTPSWLVATGFNKWGMTSSMVSANILLDKIKGIESVEQSLFNPSRFNLYASAESLLEDGLTTINALSKEIFVFPKVKIEGLPLNHGGIVECDGVKVGVYKNNEGESYLVNPRCPHLGCQLEFNPDELSWDCPCHGSRFDILGKLINNPAQEDLEHE